MMRGYSRFAPGTGRFFDSGEVRLALLSRLADEQCMTTS
jgi:hypothetical protein